MAENQAEDEDDESFGEFHFAPLHSNPTVHSTTQINGHISSTSSSDSWGDFVSTPKSSSDLSKPNISHNSVQGRVDQELTQWFKPKGAIPLSIFGELEEEEEEEEGSGPAETTIGHGATAFENKKSEKRNGSDLNVNDLIANLYNPNQQIKVENGSGVNSNGSGLDVNGNGNGLGSDFVDGNEDFDDEDDGWEFKGAESGSRIGNGESKENGDFESPGLKVEAMMQIDREIQVDGKGQEKTEEAGHTFGVGNGVYGHNDLSVVSNGISLGTGQWGFGFDFNSSSMTKQDGFISGSLSKSKYNDGANGMNSSAANKKVDSAENFWEFKDAFPGTLSKNKLEEPKATAAVPTGVEALTFDGDGARGPLDLFTVSDGISHKSGKWDSEFNFNPSPKTQDGIIMDSYSKSKQNDSVSSPVDENVGGDEIFWDFKDAFSESGSKHKSEESKLADISPAGLEAQALTFDGNGTRSPNDSFVPSHGVSHKSGEGEFGFYFNPISGTQDDFILDTNSSRKQNDLSSSPVDDNADSDENFWGFRDAFSENRLKHEEEPKVAANYSPADVEAPAFNGEIQRNEVRSENHRQPLPLSIFSDGKLEPDDSSILEDVSIFTLTSNPRNSIKSPGSNISINDLLSSLYSQAVQNAAVNHTAKASDYGVHSIPTVFESDLVNDDDDDFDNDSWDFKAAVSGDQTSVTDLGESQKNLSTILELNDCVDFYSKLKDELCSIALCHLGNMKKAQSTAALSGDDAKEKDLDEEIQTFYNELREDNLISELGQSENPSPRNICFSEFFRVLQEPKFQVLESEYQLSRRLSLAENDPGLAIELLKDVTSTLMILKLGSMEQQHYYVSTWSKVLSVCAQELKHGALIWKQSLQKNVQSQILSEHQGKKYIIALGEIYRVVEVLGASAKLYKPWILLGSTDNIELFALLSECYTIWSSSGLEDALQSISDSIDFEYDGTPKDLLESIKYIHNIDALSLQNNVFSGQTMCRLSALTAGTVPGLKLVVWNGERYFLTLANLWANLITCDPPVLPCIHVS